MQPKVNNQIALLAPEYASSVDDILQNIDMSQALTTYTVESFETGVNIAIIPIHGYLAHRSNFHINGYYTGYDFINAAIDAAEADDTIDGVVFDIQSGGGMVNGAFESSDRIKAMTKPNIAIVDASAYSAAYLLASAANMITVPKAGGVGSIGVVTMHVNMSKAYEDAGYEVKMLYSGEFKVDGNPFEALSEAAQKRIEGRLDKSYNLFVDAVADGRNIEASVVRDTKAGLYDADSAVEVGLVDMVMAPVEAYAMFADKLLNDNNGGIGMSANTQKQEDKASTPEGATVEVVVDATAMKQEGAVNERNRIKAIMGSDEANDRSTLAAHLAYDTDMSVEAAIGILGNSATETVKAEDDSQGFGAAMDATGNPNIEAEDSAGDTGMSDSDSILADLNTATGVK